MQTTTSRACLMIICTCILFGFFGGIIGVFTSANPMSYGEINYFLSVTSFLMIPGFIIAAWPTREWVLRQLQFYQQRFSGINFSKTGVGNTQI